MPCIDCMMMFQNSQLGSSTGLGMEGKKAIVDLAKDALSNDDLDSAKHLEALTAVKILRSVLQLFSE